jgi:putative tryptophan/tyrosine transport system substrate-binding protein
VTTRREALSWLSTLAVAPRLASAAARQRVAIFSNVARRQAEEGHASALKELARRGFADGGRIEVKWFALEDLTGTLAERARVVAAWKPDLILTLGTRCTSALRQATTSIPIVTSVGDMVGLGYAESLARPGGNVTGYSHGLAEVAVKQAELARALIPKLDRIAVFYLDRDEEAAIARLSEQGVRGVRLEPVMVAVQRKEEKFSAIFRDLARKGVRAGIWGEVYFVDRDAALRATREERFPLLSTWEDDVEDGMLAATFAHRGDGHGHLAASAEQILRGASPATIPVRFPERFRMVINRRTADALGIRLSPEILIRADRVIE